MQHEEENMKNSIKKFQIALEQKLKVINQMRELAETTFISDDLVPDTFKTIAPKVAIVDHRDLSDEELKLKCKNYPYGAKVKEVLLYLEEVFPFPWRVSDRTEIVLRLEGPERTMKVMGSNASSCCYQLRGKGTHKALNFGAKKNDTFYGKAEWADSNSITPKFKDEYPIPVRIMNEYSEERKQSAQWK